MPKFVLIYANADDCGIQKIRVIGVFNTKPEAKQHATNVISKFIEDNGLDPNEVGCGGYSIFNDDTGDHHKWVINEVTI